MKYQQYLKGLSQTDSVRMKKYKRKSHNEKNRDYVNTNKMLDCIKNETHILDRDAEIKGT